MTNIQLAQRIMNVAQEVNKTTPITIGDALLALEGIKPGGHTGRAAEMDDSPEGIRLKLEWFAGQILDIYEAKAWHCVNTWLNMADIWVKPIADQQANEE